MHRSGTSAITGAIHALGADLGPVQQWMAPRVDNPEGFHEHQGLTNLNDEILTTLGGNWHEPPLLAPGWERSPDLDDIRRRAERRLHDDFCERSLWVWKDPRTCLTLPFWRPLLPVQLRCVVCVRHPLDVAESLRTRDGFSIQKGVDLWLQYTAAALVHRSGAPTLFVAYDDLIDRRRAEVARLQAFVKPAASDRAALAADSVIHQLRHSHTRVDAPGASNAALGLYLTLLSLVARQQGLGLDLAELDLIGPLLAKASLASSEREHASRRAAETTTALREALAAATAQADDARGERDALRAACEETLSAERSARLAAEARAAEAARDRDEVRAASEQAIETERRSTRDAERAAEAWRLQAERAAAQVEQQREAAERARLTHARELEASETARRSAEEARVTTERRWAAASEAEAATRREAAALLVDREAALAAAERERSRLDALLQHLATPAGVVKLALRVGLPAPVHSALRRLAGR
jgi:hypothetical protein